MVTATADIVGLTFAEQAKAIGLMLESELGSPVALFDAQFGTDLLREAQDDQPVPLGIGELTLEAIQAYASMKRSLVLILNEESYRIVFPIKESGTTKIIGQTVLARFARTPEDTQVEMQRLEKLCTLLLNKILLPAERVKSTAEPRHRDSQSARVLAAFDILLRNTRIHGDSTRFQRHALKAITDLLGAESAICSVGNLTAVHGNRGDGPMSPWECRQLAALLSERTDWDELGILIDNSIERGPIAKRFPGIASIIAVNFSLNGIQGYLVAINKAGRTSQTPDKHSADFQAPVAEKNPAPGFHKSDAAMLASFSTLVVAQARTSSRHQDLKDLVVGLTRALTAAIDAKDSYTAGHSERVARMSVELGKELGLPEEQLNDIYLAGLLHDIGKIGIRDEVLGKNGRLTDDERAHINEHVEIGYRILSELTGIDHLLGGVRFHHEQYNGTGYPHGLIGEKIPRLARILAVADAFDAMSSDRPYRKGMPLKEVEEVFQKGSGKQWDPVIVNAFMSCKARLSEIRQKGIGDSLREALNGAMRQEPYKEDASLSFAIKRNRGF